MISLVCLLTVILFIILVKPVHAYLDPGTGSMAVQAVIAVIAAASVSIGIFRRRVASFFGKLFGKKIRKADSENDKINS